MPFVKAAEVSVPFDKDFTGEVIGTGDGIQVTFNIALINKPVFIDSLSITHTQGSTQHTDGTSDSAGTITGTNITSGSIAKDGTGSITFTAAPDDGVDITIDYKARGLITEVVDFLTDDRKQTSETLGTGNGVLVTFSGTLTNGPVAKGQCRIEFTIGNITYRIYDDGSGAWLHDEISTSSLNYTTKAWSITFNKALDNGKNLDTLYSHSGTEGKDWVVLTERNTRDNGGSDAYTGEHLKEVILKNSGSSYKESIYIGFRECKSEANSFYAVNLNGYYQRLDDDADWNNNSGSPSGHGKTTYDATRELYSTMPRISLNDDTIRYWIYSSKNRVVVIARITGSVFESLYIGHGQRFSAASDYPNPMIILGSHSGTNNHTDTGTNHTFIIAPKTNGDNALVVDPNNNYGDSSTGVGEFSLEMITPNAMSTSSVASLDPTTTGDHIRLPVYAYLERDDFNLMTLEGVYFVPAESVQSEDTQTINSVVHDLFENVSNISYEDFMGVEVA